MKWLSQVLDAMRLKSYSELKGDTLLGYNAAEVVAVPFPFQWIDPNLCCDVGKAGGRVKVNGILAAVDDLIKDYPDLAASPSVRVVKLMKDMYEVWRGCDEGEKPQPFPSMDDFRVGSWWYVLLGPTEVKKICGWLDKMEADLWRCAGQIRAADIASGGVDPLPEGANVEIV